LLWHGRYCLLLLLLLLLLLPQPLAVTCICSSSSTWDPPCSWCFLDSLCLLLCLHVECHAAAATCCCTGLLC
jgi:hypothetical protein